MPKIFDGKVFDELEKDLGKMGDKVDKNLLGSTSKVGKNTKIKEVKIRDIQLGKKGW